jgi:hypothetical protein
MRRFPTLSAIAASLLCLFFLFAAVIEAASATGRYRIELKDGHQIETRGYPVARGTVWTFHGSNGVLTGVPRELVARIVPVDEDAEPDAVVSARGVAAAPAESDVEAAPAPLEPGEWIELPSTGDGRAAVAPAEVIGPNETPAVPAPGHR